MNLGFVNSLPNSQFPKIPTVCTKLCCAFDSVLTSLICDILKRVKLFFSDVILNLFTNVFLWNVESNVCGLLQTGK